MDNKHTQTYGDEHTPSAHMERIDNSTHIPKQCFNVNVGKQKGNERLGKRTSECALLCLWLCVYTTALLSPLGCECECKCESADACNGICETERHHIACIDSYSQSGILPKIKHSIYSLLREKDKDSGTTAPIHKLMAVCELAHYTMFHNF